MDRGRNMSDIRFVYITAGSFEAAKNIGHALVANRLAACVNILENMHSLYWWEGRVQEDKEVVLVAKSTVDKVNSLMEKVKELHPYQCPCILSLAVENGNPDFFDWIRAETG
jgi:periplasmic divalent cation tolerance protein